MKRVAIKPRSRLALRAIGDRINIKTNAKRKEIKVVEQSTTSHELKYERSFKDWFNYMLCSRGILDHCETNTSKSSDKLETIKSRSIAILKAKRVYESGESDVLGNIERAVDQGYIRMGKDVYLYADVGLRKFYINLLQSYSPSYLSLGLETVLNKANIYKESPKDTKLSKIIVKELLNNKEISQKYKLQPSLMKQEMDKYVLKMFLKLVWCLDYLKMNEVLVNVCLFRVEANFKSSNQILCEFTRKCLSGEGDTVMSLSYIGYNLLKSQNELDEYDYHVKNIAVDLRSGVRLAKLAEIIAKANDTEICDIMGQISLSESKFRRAANVKIALETFEKCGVDIQDITPIQIVEGLRSPTLKLLWNISLSTTLLHLVQINDLKKEIERIKLAGQIDSLCSERIPPYESLNIIHEFNRSVYASLLEWCQVICIQYGFVIKSYASSFLDYQAFCFIIHYYIPEAIPLHRIEKTDFIGNQTLLKNALDIIGHIPFLGIKSKSDASNEKANMIFLSYLYERLTTMSRERQAVLTIQKLFRRANRHTYKLEFNQNILRIQAHIRGLMVRSSLAELEKAIKTIQRTIRNRKMERLKEKENAVVLLQSFMRMNRERTRYIALKQSIVIIQSALRTWHTLVNFEKLHKACIIIQTQVRIRKERQLYENKRQHVIILQSWWRSHVEIKQYQAMQEHVLMIQSYIRSARERYHYRQKVQATEELAVLLRKYADERRRSSLQTIFQRLQAWGKIVIKKREALLCLQRFIRSWKEIYNYKHKIKCISTLQSFFRMVQERNQFLEKRRAAVLVQSFIRRFQCMRQFQLLKKSVIKIQAIVRMKQAQDSFQTLKLKVIRIQAVLRSYREKKHYEDIKKHVTLIQATYRAYVERNMFLKRKNSILIIQATTREYQEYKRQKASIEILQSLYRSYISRSWYIKKRDSAILLQKIYRMYIEREAFMRMKSAVKKVQACIRSYLDQRMYNEKKYACVILQSRYRMFEVMKNFKQKKAHTVILQSHIRAVLESRKYTLFTRKVAIVQSHIRTYIEHKRYCHYKDATCTIQNTVRMYAEKERFNQLKQAVSLLQGLFRVVLHNDHVCKLNAAIVLQSAYRKRIAEDTYRAKKQACLTLQNATREILMWKKVKTEESIIVIQSFFRSLHDRNIFHKKLESVKLLQNVYRSTASNIEKPVVYKKGPTLGDLTHFALGNLMASSNLTVVVKRCATLEMSTKYSDICALSCLEYQVIPVLFNLMNDCNRSEPHIKLVVSVLNILNNVASHKERSCPYLYSQYPFAFSSLILLISKFKNVHEVIHRVIKLIMKLLPYTHLSQLKSNEISKLISMHTYLKKKLQSESRVVSKPFVYIKKLKRIVNNLQSIVDALNSRIE